MEAKNWCTHESCANYDANAVSTCNSCVEGATESCSNCTN